jgi:PTH1 family peptidyl-tRNA hydrolase
LKLIVGIGNPGKKYEGTRHNIGFRVVGAIQDSGVRLAEGTKLLKPETFVNRTGEAVRQMAKKYRLLQRNILVVCDDVTLDFGKLRLRRAGSAGGHHGLLSVIEGLESEDFPRLRFGIRSAEMPVDLTDFVLGKFSAAEYKRVPALVESAVQVCRSWANEGFEKAQSELGRLQNQKQGVSR